MIRRTLTVIALLCLALAAAACSDARVDRPIVDATYNIHHDPSLATAAAPESPNANP